MGQAEGAGARATETPPISVVLPAFNEEGNIAPMLDHVLEVLPGLAREFEVIVVDDGSTDATGEAARRYVDAHHPRVRLLRHEVNRGYGAALRSGLDAARHEMLFYTDADRQFDVAELGGMLPLMREADMVLGYRTSRDDRLLRSALSWAYNRLIDVLLRVRVRDVNCSFKLFSREAWEAIVVESDEFLVDAEIVARVRQAGFRILQRGVRHYPRVAGDTTVGASDIPSTLRAAVRIRRRIRRPETAEPAAGSPAPAAVEVEPS